VGPELEVESFVWSQDSVGFQGISDKFWWCSGQLVTFGHEGVVVPVWKLDG